MKKINILVFPCGSEIGLEIYRSLQYSLHVNLIGGNSVKDHGLFVFDNYIDNIPFVYSEVFISSLKKIVLKNQIDAIYPAMDSVLSKLKKHETELGCKIISSCYNTTEVCLSKLDTYKLLDKKIRVPKIYSDLDKVSKYPIFIKPIIGYGSRNVYKADSIQDAKMFFKKLNAEDYVISEYLPNEEYTVDCFTNRHGRILFVGPRKRNRVTNGISVNTIPVSDNLDEFYEMANKINEALSFRGAWFFQVKRNCEDQLVLLEVASRLAGSSSLYRGLGVNFALLSVFDAFNFDVDIRKNNYSIELDRALDNKYKVDINYLTVYVDYDDCLIINGSININLLTFLYQSFNDNKKIVLITRHNGDISKDLKKFRLDSLFDEVFQIDKHDKKYKYMTDKHGIFIDDSFAERKEVQDQIGIPVFSPDMVEVLLK